MVEAAGKQFSKEMQRCIDECTRCHQVCLTTAGHALRHGAGENTNHMIRVLSDCVEICQTSANFMLRGSPNHGETCRVCAEICRECEKACREFDDEPMRRCAEVCRSCAESCEAMAA